MVETTFYVTFGLGVLVDTMSLSKSWGFFPTKTIIVLLRPGPPMENGRFQAWVGLAVSVVS